MTLKERCGAAGERRSKVNTDCRFLKAQGTRMGTTPRQPRTDCSGAPCHFRAAMAYKNL